MENTAPGHVSSQVPTGGSWANSRILPVQPRPGHSPSPTKVSRQWETPPPCNALGKLEGSWGDLAGCCWEPVSTMLTGLGPEAAVHSHMVRWRSLPWLCSQPASRRPAHPALHLGSKPRISVLAGTALPPLLWCKNSPFPAKAKGAATPGNTSTTDHTWQHAVDIQGLVPCSTRKAKQAMFPLPEPPAADFSDTVASLLRCVPLGVPGRKKGDQGSQLMEWRACVELPHQGIPNNVHRLLRHGEHGCTDSII